MTSLVNPGAGAPIVVYGATGHTGRFVCEELRRRGVSFVISGRSASSLSALAAVLGMPEFRPASIEDAKALRLAFHGARAVINCAGPFLDTAEPVCAAALDAGAHYLDVTAEQAAASQTLKGFARRGRERGLAVLPASAFYGGLADLLATVAMEPWPVADKIEVAVALDSWHPTAGTRVTGQRNTFARLCIVDGALKEVRQPAPTATWQFAWPFGSQSVIELPFTETIAIQHHLAVREVHSYLTLASLDDVRNSQTPAPVIDPETGKSSQRFHVEVVAHRGGALRRATVSGRDIYAVSAPIVVEAALRLLSETPVREGGAFSLAQRFDARDFLRALEPHGLEIRLPVA